LNTNDSKFKCIVAHQKISVEGLLTKRAARATYTFERKGWMMLVGSVLINVPWVIALFQVQAALSQAGTHMLLS
jgi:hypothetical protein